MVYHQTVSRGRFLPGKAKEMAETPGNRQYSKRFVPAGSGRENRQSYLSKGTNP